MTLNALPQCHGHSKVAVSVPDIPLVDLAEWHPVVNQGLDVMGSIAAHGYTVEPVGDGLLKDRTQGFGIFGSQSRQVLFVRCW